MKKNQISLNVLKVMPVCFGFSAFIFAVVFRDIREVPLRDFLFFVTAIFTVFSFVFFLGGQLTKPRGKKTKRSFIDYFYMTFASIVFASAIAILMLILSYLLDQAYTGAIILRFAGIIGAGAIASFASYYALGESAHAEGITVTKYLSVLMFGGLLLSALAQTDPNWYAVSFSYLGMTEGTTSAIIFNLTMMLTGLGTIALAKFIFDDIDQSTIRKEIDNRSYLKDKIIFAIMGIGIFIVGFIPYKEGIQGAVHTAGAMAAGISFLFLCIFSKTLLSGLSKAFYNLTYCFALIVFSSGLAYLFGAASLATTELIVFISVFVWVYLMLEAVRLTNN